MSTASQTGKASNTSINGSAGGDTLAGTASAEKIDSKVGNDTITGGGGDDWVKGGPDSDVINGGAGSDRVDGNAGDDRLLYTVGENTNAKDLYDGGSGTNTLVLSMTRSEWMRDDVQADIAAVLKFLASVAPNANGVNSSKGFQFTAFGLEVRRISALELLVDGVAQDPRDAPVDAINDSQIATTEHSVVVGDVVANDYVPDLVRSVELVTAPDKGTLELLANGSYRYDPGVAFDTLAFGMSAKVNFTYRVSDADRDSDTAVATITITGTNDAPVANSDSGTTSENTASLVDVLANDTDVDSGDTRQLLSVSVSQGAGTAAVTGNKAQWTPGTAYDYLAAGESAQVTLAYVMSDNNGAQAGSTLTLTVTGVNDAPVAVDDTATTSENSVITVDVLLNDTDVDASDARSLTQAALQSGKGSVVITDNKLVWTPGKDYDTLPQGGSATVSIGYTVSDKQAATDAGLLTLTVTGANDAPVANADSGTTVENAALVVDVLANDVDVDNGDTKQIVSIAATPGKGSSIVTADNKLQWSPGTDFDSLAAGTSAQVAIAYVMKDSNGAESNAAVTITVTGTNDAPVAKADSSTTAENAMVLVDVLANDTDVDSGDTRQLMSVVVSQGNGTASVIDNKVQWSPGTGYDYLAVNQSATVTMAYAMKDSQGAEASSTLSLTVTGVNDAPVAVDDKATADENSTVIVDLVANDTDVDASDIRTLSQVSLQGGQGNVSITDNKLVWSPGTKYNHLDQGAIAIVSVGYTVTDKQGASDTGVLDLTVTGINDAPTVAGPVSVAIHEDDAVQTINLLQWASDVDAGAVLSVSGLIDTSGKGGWTLQGNSLRFDPNHFNSLNRDEVVTMKVIYRVDDQFGASANQALNIAVGGRNDAPTVAGPLTVAVNEQNDPLSINLLTGASDVDAGAVLSISGLIEASGLGGWTLQGNSLRFDPNHFDRLSNGETATVKFVYRVDDQFGASANQALTVTVSGFTDAPSLAVVAAAGSSVNEVKLTITTAPVSNEKVALGFANLPAGSKVLNTLRQDITAGVPDATGTYDYFVVLPSGADINGKVDITATGVRADNTKTGSASGSIDLVSDHDIISESLEFTSDDQGMWASGGAPLIAWREYIPIIGGAARTWNGSDWVDTNAAPWRSGQVSLFSASTNVKQAADIAKGYVDAGLVTAQTVLNGAKAAANATFDVAVGVYHAAAGAANNVYNVAVGAAKAVHDDAVGTVATAASDAAWAVYNGAVEAAAKVRDDAHNIDFLDLFVDLINKTYAAAVDAAAVIRDAALVVVNTAKQAAIDAYNTAVSVAKSALDTSLQLAGEALFVADGVKNAALNSAQAIFDAAKKSADDASTALTTQLQGETKLEIKADLFAEVGVQVDFVLDSGSVDTSIKYQLTSALQYNKTTDVLAITPQLANTTTGAAVAFSTMSPSAKLKAVLVYDVGAELQVFIDSNLVAAGKTIYDLSPVSNGLAINTTVSTGGWGAEFEALKSLIIAAAGPGADVPFADLKVGEFVLVDLDSKNVKDFELTFIETLTDDIAKVEVGLPSIETSGKAATFNANRFTEGGLVAVDVTEITEALMSVFNARLDFGKEVRQTLGIGSLGAPSMGDAITIVAKVLTGDSQAVAAHPNLIPVWLRDKIGSLGNLSTGQLTEAINVAARAFLTTMFDLLDNQVDEMPLFLIDVNDDTPATLAHLNLIPDSLTQSTVNSNTANFGFYAAYGESNNLVKVTIDVDQAVAVILNKIVEAAAAAASGGATAPVTEALPTINPLNIQFGIEEILKAFKIPGGEVTKYLDLSLGFEAADLDVSSSLRFSQEFSLSIDDMVYNVTMEDGKVFTFASNAKGTIEIPNASSHDKNGDGNIDYSMQLVPKAMFSNDTEIGLTVGYVLDFLKANLAADLKLPGLAELLQVKIPGLPDLTFNMADMAIGPLLRVEGDLDLASADIFEARFAINLGSATVSNSVTATDDSIVTIVGVPTPA